MNRKTDETGTYYVYIVECSDGAYYTGYTIDLKNRIRLHNNGRGAKYTRSKRPVKLVWCNGYECFKEAVKSEADIKKLTRKQKEELVKTYMGEHSFSR